MHCNQTLLKVHNNHRRQYNDMVRTQVRTNERSTFEQQQNLSFLFHRTQPANTLPLLMYTSTRFLIGSELRRKAGHNKTD